MNFIKKVLYRVCVIVCLIFLLAFLSQFFPFLNGFIVNVNAQENNDLPLKIRLEDGDYDSLINKDSIYSNTFTNESASGLNNVSFYSYATYDLSHCEQHENSNCGIRNSPTPGYYSFSYNEDISLPKSNYSDSTGWVGSFKFLFAPDMQVKTGNHYTFFYLLKKLEKNSDLRFNSNSNFQPTLTGLNFSNENGSEYNVLNQVENLNYYYYITYKDVGSQNSYSYLKIEFDVPDLSIFNNQDLYLSSILFDVNEPYYNIELPFDFLINYNTTEDRKLSHSVYFIENGDVAYNGIDCFGDICSDVLSNLDMDGVSPQDVQVLKGIEICPDTISSLSDLACYIRRVFDMIFRFFTRFGNFFKQLLAPNDNFTIAQQFFDTFHLEDGGLSQIIRSPLTFISSLNSTTCTPISLPLLSTSFVLPCFSSFYREKFPAIFNIYQIVSTGIICYYCLIKVFYIIKGLQTPDSDKVEVLDL